MMNRLFLLTAFILVLFSCEKEKVNNDEAIVPTDITAIVIDGFGNKWVGAKNGLFIIKDSVPVLVINSKLNSVINHISLYGSEEIMTATPMGGGLAYINADGITGATNYNTSNTSNAMKSANVLVVNTDVKDRRWYVTDKGIAIFDGSDWYAITNNSKMSEENFTSALPTGIASGGGDTSFIATQGLGVAVYTNNGVDGITCATRYENWGPCPLPAEVNCVYAISGTNQWYGTKTGAYHHPSFDIKSTWNSYDISNGLINDNVLCIIQDKDKNIWLGTEAGVSVYNGTDFTNYTAETAAFLPGNKITAMAVDKDGTIWFGTDKGIGKLTPIAK